MVQELFRQIQNQNKEILRLRGEIRRLNSSGGGGGGSSPIANLLFLPAEENLTIASGEIDILSSHHKVDTEAAAASDDLDTINGGSNGRVLIIRPFSGARTIVIKHNTGNILVVGNADITLDDVQDFAILIYDTTATTWYAR